MTAIKNMIVGGIQKMVLRLVSGTEPQTAGAMPMVGTFVALILTTIKSERQIAVVAGL